MACVPRDPSAAALIAAADRAGVGLVASVEGGLYVSAGAAALLGWDGSDRARLADLLPAEPGTHSVVLKTKDGTELALRVTRDADVWVLRKARGDVLGAIERARAEFQRLLDAAPDGVAVVGERGLLYANPALLRWVGFSDVATFARARLVEVMHTHDVPKAVEAVRSLLDRSGSRGVLRVRVRRPSGGLFDAECIGLATEWEGQPACLIVGRDLSQRRLDQSRLIVADRSASVGTLSAGVAHEINNPLAYLLLNLEYLIRELPGLSESSGRRTHLLGRLNESKHGAERVGHILKELGSLSSRRKSQQTGVDVVEVMQRALRTLERELSERARVRLETQPTPDVDGDPNGLEQLFVNLLSNAAQAMPEPRAEQSEVVVRFTTAEDGNVLIEVADNGAGIAPEHLGRIFDPFFTTKPSGTGLGLPISHAIARSLGGSIAVKSELGRGTTFSVVLPRGSARRTERPPTSSSPPSDGRRARVLVVDDDAPVAETLSRALAESYDVSVATSAREALALLEHDSCFDVVLCDLMMPEMNGMDLHRELSERRPGLEQRLVFMTGGAFTPRAREFLARVENPRLEKPFEFESFHAIVGARLAQGG